MFMKSGVCLILAMGLPVMALETKPLPEKSLSFIGTYEVLKCSNLGEGVRQPERIELTKNPHDDNTLNLKNYPNPSYGNLEFNLRIADEKVRNSDPTECSMIDSEVEVSKFKTKTGKVEALKASDIAGDALCIPPWPPAWANYKKNIRKLTLYPSAPNSTEYFLVISEKDETAGAKKPMEMWCRLKKL